MSVYFFVDVCTGMSKNFVSAYPFSTGSVEECVAGMPAIVGRVFAGDPAGRQSVPETFPISSLCDVLCAVMVKQAFKTWVFSGCYHAVYFGMNGDRSVFALFGLGSAGKRARFQVDLVKRHPGKFVDPKTGITQNQDRINKRFVFVRPELGQFIS